MSYKDRLKQNQGGSDIPKMEVSMRLTAKAKDSKPGFVYIKDEDGVKTEQFSNFAIKGVLLGTGMVLNAYSKSLGAKGGSFHSTVYFRKTDTITLFGPTASGYKKEMTGTLDQVEDFLTAKRRTITDLDKTKKQMVMYILTEKSGLLEIRTNLTLGFDQTKNVQKGSCEMLVLVTAGIYSPANPAISASSKKILGALAEKNPPCYCVVTLTDVAITDELAEKINLDKALDDYEKFKNYASSAVPDADQPVPDHTPAPAAAGSGANAFDDNPIGEIPADVGDDLPF